MEPPAKLQLLSMHGNGNQNFLNAYGVLASLKMVPLPQVTQNMPIDL